MSSEARSGAVPLPYPCLCLVTDSGVCPPDELPGRAAAAVIGGVDIVQVRDKEMAGGELLERVRALRRSLPSGALLLVNERADVAVAAGADGVQLGEAAMPTASVRLIAGDDATIGRSVHSVESAVAAANDGADFLLVGTMFATRSHPGEEPSGPGLIERIRSAGVETPLMAIGGITAANVGQVMEAGATGAAVITAILGSDDPGLAAERLKSAMLDAAGNEAGRDALSRQFEQVRAQGGVAPP